MDKFITTENPWKKAYGFPLKSVPTDYCLNDNERNLFNEFNYGEDDSNDKKEINKEFAIHTEVYPFAYSASVDTAKIIILVTNPGYDVKDKEPKYENEEIIMNNLKVITEEIKVDEKKEGYWSTKLKALSDNNKDIEIRDKIALIEYFPYHSIKFKKIPKKLFNKHYPKEEEFLEGQKYSFYKLQNSINRGCVIICPRSVKVWSYVIENITNKEAVDDLITVKNYRQPYITINNLTNGETDWEKINQALRG